MIIRQCQSAYLFALFCIISLASCATNPNPPGTAKNKTSVASSEQAFNSIVTKGDEALSSRAFSDAQVQYALAIKEQPNNIELLYKLAIVHYEKKSFDVARELLRTIIDRDDAHIGAYEMLGLIALKGEDMTLAEKNLEKAIELDSTRWRSQNAMGIVKDMQSIHAEAQQHFQQALRSSPDKAQIENNLGYSHYLDGNFNQAEKHYRNATQFNPNYEKAWANLGLLFVRSKQYENARYAFGKVVDDHIASNNLGFLSMLQGDNEMARQELSRAILLAPTYYPKASENLTSLDTNKRFSNSVELALMSANANSHSVAAEPLESNLTVETDNDAVKGAQVIILESAYTTDSTTDIAKKSTQGKRAVGDNLSRQYLKVLGHQVSDDSDSLYYSVLSFQANHLLEPTGVLDGKSMELLTKQARKRVKAMLVALNYDVNSGSEILDAESIESLKQFQRNNSLSVSGEVDKDTLLVLTRYLNGGDIVYNDH